MKVTLFHYTDQMVISSVEWTELMKRIRDGYWRDIVEKCHDEQLGNDEMKKRLPAFGISVTFTGGDEAANVVRYNHIVGIDFNKVISKDLSGIQKIDECRAMCHDIPSVVGFYVTKSGMGFRVFVLVNTGIDEHKIIYHLLQEYFEGLFNLQADDKYKDITKLSFVTYDPDCFYRRIEDTEPFDMKSFLPDLKNNKVFPGIGVTERKVWKYLSSKYDFRYNILERVSQCRLKCDISDGTAQTFKWKNIDDRINDMMVCDIENNCMHITYNQLKWIVDNHIIKPDYNPLTDFCSRIAVWDGCDYIKEYAVVLNIDDVGKFNDVLRIWLTNMYMSWTDTSKHNDMILMLQSDVQYSGKTDWALHILPSELRQYQLATNINFIYEEEKPYLLFVIEDFNGHGWERIRMLKEKNPMASIIITCSSDIRIRKIEGLDIKQIKVKKRIGNDLLIPDPGYLYTQVKYMADK